MRQVEGDQGDMIEPEESSVMLVTDPQGMDLDNNRFTVMVNEEQSSGN